MKRFQELTQKTAVADTDTVAIQETSDGVYKYATVLDVVADVLSNGNMTTAFTTTGVITGGTLEATADTSAGDNAAMGYTATEGLVLTGQGSTNDVTIKNDADASVLEVATGTQNVELTNGNLIIGTSGKGIDFSATSDAGGMTSELLDDYEEGTWTANVQDTSFSDGEGQSVSQSCIYTKIGREVFFSGNLTVTSLGTLTTSSITYISGFPFASSGVSGGGMVVTYASSLSLGTASSLTGLMRTSNSECEMYQWDGTGGPSNLTLAELTASGHLRFQGRYSV